MLVEIPGIPEVSSCASLSLTLPIHCDSVGKRSWPLHSEHLRNCHHRDLLGALQYFMTIEARCGFTPGSQALLARGISIQPYHLTMTKKKARLCHYAHLMSVWKSCGKPGLRLSWLHGAQIRETQRIGNQLGALVHQRAVITEEFKVPDKMVGFIIGRGGEQISRIQAESGCKIQIAPDSGGMAERPCVLTGTPESIEQAKRLLGQIVDRCRNGPGFHNDVDGNSTIQEILIPASKVGLVIGKGGETIKQLQERTGVKMIMIQDGPLPTGADKPLRITGDAFKVQQAREMVLEIIREKDQADFRGVRNDFTSRMGGGSIEVSVPRFAVGIVIGRNGEMIKKIQNDAGMMGLAQKESRRSWVFRIGVSTPLIINELILTAQERDGFGSLAVARGRGRGRGDWSVGTPGGVQEITYTGGENIKSINQQSGAHVELQRNPPPNTDPNVRIFTIRGVPQQIELARHLIDEKVGGTSLGGPGGFGQNPFSQPPATHQNGPQAFMTQSWGGTYQPWQQPGQQVPNHNGTQSGQVEFTKAWEDYYKKLGQQTQQQNSQPDYSKAWEDYYKKQSHAATAASQASSQPDYTMAWAEYYRQQAAYYGQTLGQAQAHSQEQ
ncbi:UNVERIFIED_CONTAM: Far upstream element-binding protein 3 [Gekko kuhli]